jgi:hypothetical protein
MSHMTWATAAVTFAISIFSVACQSGGVGDPCVPEDEYQKYTSGFAVSEVNQETKSFQCETRLCLVNHFQGRVSCPYGQLEAKATDTNYPAEKEYQLCHIPGTSGVTNRIQVQVNPQLDGRRASDTVYCSCRCDGAEANARYCKCPSGFSCEKLIDRVGALPDKQLAGSFCIKDGTKYDTKNPNDGAPCNATKPDAPANEAPGNCGLYNGQ